MKPIPCKYRVSRGGKTRDCWLLAFANDSNGSVVGICQVDDHLILVEYMDLILPLLETCGEVTERLEAEPFREKRP